MILLFWVFPLVGTVGGIYFLRRAWKRLRKPIDEQNRMRSLLVHIHSALGFLLDFVIGLWFIFCGVSSTLWLIGVRL